MAISTYQQKEINMSFEYDEYKEFELYGEAEITEQTLQDTILVAEYANHGNGGASHALWKFFMMLYGYAYEFSYDELRMLDQGYLGAVHRLFDTFAGGRNSFERFVDEYKDVINFDFRRQWD